MVREANRGIYERYRWARSGVVLLMSLVPALACSQAPNWPAKPVTLITPFPAGGPVDAEVRLYTLKLNQALGQPFILDAKPGAGTTIGTAYVAKSASDGYTLLVTNSSFSITPAFYPDLPYDPLRDIAPISLMSKRSTGLFAAASAPFGTLAAYLAHARAHPGEINMGTVGAGGALHLSGAWLHSATGTEVTFVHYKGAGPMYIDMFAGRTQAAFVGLSSALPYLKAGKLKLLAIANLERSPLMPAVPTVAEQVVPGFEYSSWIGIAGPAAIPPAVLEKINAEFVKVARAPDIAEKLAPSGTMLVGSTPALFRQYLAQEINRWKKLVSELGIKAEP